MEQTEIALSGSALRDEGIQKAVDHANEKTEKWSDRALAFLKQYASTNSVFSGEQVRFAAGGVIPFPPHLRAWGGVMMSAARQGLIEKIGYIQVENPLAHRANAALWRSKIY